MKKVLSFFTILMFSASGFSLEVDSVGLRQRKYDLKEVCKEMGFDNLLMVSARDQLRVDCMGKFVRAIDFCVKKTGSYLSRAYVLEKSKEVICEEASDVVVKLPCKGVYRERCIDLKDTCLKIRPAFAFKHELYHYFEVENTLHCKYQAEILIENLEAL